MDGQGLTSTDAAHEGGHLTAALPRRVEGEGQDVHRAGFAVEGVAGVEERGLPGRRQTHADIADPWNLFVDQGVDGTVVAVERTAPVIVRSPTTVPSGW